MGALRLLRPIETTYVLPCIALNVVLFKLLTSVLIVTTQGSAAGVGFVVGFDVVAVGVGVGVGVGVSSLTDVWVGFEVGLDPCPTSSLTAISFTVTLSFVCAEVV